MNALMIMAMVSTFSPLVPLLLYYRRSIENLEVRILRWLLLMAFVADLASMALAFSRGNTYPVTNLYILVQALLLLYIYKSALKFSQKLFYFFGLAYTLFFIVNMAFFQGYDTLNTYVRLTSSAIFIMMSLLYFTHLLRSLPEFFVYRIPMVWINIAVLVYFAGNLLVFVFNDKLIMTYTWIIHNILNITKNLLFTVAVWQAQRRIKSSSS